MIGSNLTVGISSGRITVTLDDGRVFDRRIHYMSNPEGTDSDLVERIEEIISIFYRGRKWVSIEEKW